MPRRRLIQVRSGTTAQWAAANPVLALGEPGYDTDTKVYKIGDGVSAWSALAGANSGTYVEQAGEYPAATTDAMTAQVTGDTNPRFTINADGKIEWGPGNAALDTALYRVSPGRLDMSGNLYVSSDTANRVTIGNVGAPGLSFGSAGDTNLYRSAANTLRTDDLLLVDRLGTFQSTPPANVMLYSVAASATWAPAVLRGAAAQTANLTEWQNSAGALLASLQVSGGDAGLLNLLDGGVLAGQLFAGSGTDVFLDQRNASGSGRLRSQDGSNKVQWSNTGLGFFAAAPVAKPTVTGSRSLNPALASLLTALANLGLITDSSTA